MQFLRTLRTLLFMVLMSGGFILASTVSDDGKEEFYKILPSILAILMTDDIAPIAPIPTDLGFERPKSLEN